MPEVIDMLGQRFGRLVVVERAPRLSPRNRRARWVAVCDCGQRKSYDGSSLRTGAIRSCGCLQAELLSERTRLDLTGQVFGRLTVIAFDEVRNRNRMWLCECSCGKRTSISTGNLRRGTKSCGCAQPEIVRAFLTKAVVGYAAAHARLRRRLGPASSHLCVDCGEPAIDWSYDGLDPNELTAGKHDYYCAYSLDPAHYAPRCRQCHKRYDHTAADECRDEFRDDVEREQREYGVTTDFNTPSLIERHDA